MWTTQPPLEYVVEDALVFGRHQVLIRIAFLRIGLERGHVGLVLTTTAADEGLVGIRRQRGCCVQVVDHVDQRLLHVRVAGEGERDLTEAAADVGRDALHARRAPQDLFLGLDDVGLHLRRRRLAPVVEHGDGRLGQHRQQHDRPAGDGQDTEQHQQGGDGGQGRGVAQAGSGQVHRRSPSLQGGCLASFPARIEACAKAPKEGVAKTAVYVASRAIATLAHGAA